MKQLHIFILFLCLHLCLGDLGMLLSPIDSLNGRVEKCSPKLKSLLEQSSDSNVMSVWIQFHDKPSVEIMKRDKTDIVRIFTTKFNLAIASL